MALETPGNGAHSNLAWEELKPLLDAAIDANLARVPVAETLNRLDIHSQEIATRLGTPRQPARKGGRQNLDTGRQA